MLLAKRFGRPRLHARSTRAWGHDGPALTVPLPQNREIGRPLRCRGAGRLRVSRSGRPRQVDEPGGQLGDQPPNCERFLDTSRTRRRIARSREPGLGYRPAAGTAPRSDHGEDFAVTPPIAPPRLPSTSGIFSSSGADLRVVLQVHHPPPGDLDREIETPCAASANGRPRSRDSVQWDVRAGHHAPTHAYYVHESLRPTNSSQDISLVHTTDAGRRAVAVVLAGGIPAEADIDRESCRVFASSRHLTPALGRGQRPVGLSASRHAESGTVYYASTVPHSDAPLRTAGGTFRRSCGPSQGVLHADGQEDHQVRVRRWRRSNGNPLAGNVLLRT